MARITQEVKNEIIKIESMLKKVNGFLEDAPVGHLKLQNKKGKIYYYHRYQIESDFEQSIAMDNQCVNKNESRKIWKKEYIKRNSNMAEMLAQKQYYISIKPILETKLCALKSFLKDYQGQNVCDVFDRLSLGRKALVVPLQVSINERIKMWNEEKYEKNNKYPENLKYETEQGDLVRSKSEVIIANILYKRKRDILYKYERPLTLKIDGKEITIHPDFTVLNVHTGKIVYWEHAGRMDDPYYANEFVRKINGYIANDLLPGTDVILTFETQGNAIDIAQVRQWADSLVCL